MQAKKDVVLAAVTVVFACCRLRRDRVAYEVFMQMSAPVGAARDRLV